jgi:hypothetical protein
MREHQIQNWIDTLNKTIASLAAFRDALGQAAGQDPLDVDALALDRLSHVAYKHVFDLADALAVSSFYEFMAIVTGRNPLYYMVKNSILERLAGRPVLERLIRAMGETDPAAAAELQALLNETWEADR